MIEYLPSSWSPRPPIELFFSFVFVASYKCYRTSHLLCVVLPVDCCGQRWFCESMDSEGCYHSFLSVCSARSRGYKTEEQRRNETIRWNHSISSVWNRVFDLLRLRLYEFVCFVLVLVFVVPFRCIVSHWLPESLLA